MPQLNIGDRLPSTPVVKDNADPQNEFLLASRMYTMTWTIDNPAVLTVDSSDLGVKALSPGQGTITWKATPAGGSKYSAGPSETYIDGPYTVLPPPEFVSLVVNH